MQERHKTRLIKGQQKMGIIALTSKICVNALPRSSPLPYIKCQRGHMNYFAITKTRVELAQNIYTHTFSLIGIPSQLSVGLYCSLYGFETKAFLLAFVVRLDSLLTFTHRYLNLPSVRQSLLVEEHSFLVFVLHDAFHIPTKTSEHRRNTKHKPSG